jgi:hypothetical protein
MNRILTSAWPFAVAAGALAIVAFPQAVELLLAGVCAFLIIAGVPAFYLAARRAGGRA